MKSHMMMFVSAGLVMLPACKPLDQTPAADETATISLNVNIPDENREAVSAYQRANAKMHENMAAVHPDPDIAFMQGMIPHHQGAVEMAKIVLKYGKDPETQALAQQIIDSQRKEIEQMQAWLKKHGAEPSLKKSVASSADDHADH